MLLLFFDGTVKVRKVSNVFIENLLKSVYFFPTARNDEVLDPWISRTWFGAVVLKCWSAHHIFKIKSMAATITWQVFLFDWVEQQPEYKTNLALKIGLLLKLVEVLCLEVAEACGDVRKSVWENDSHFLYPAPETKWVCFFVISFSARKISFSLWQQGFEMYLSLRNVWTQALCQLAVTAYLNSVSKI